MSTPHRGLPPPTAMTIPQLTQGAQPIRHPPLSQPMGQLPPRQQWQGAGESMRDWLHAKAEEDKRKREEEKTEQELLRLEQRRIEQDMLQTAVTGGIPSYMIPMVFAGMGGGNLPNASSEWAQHYMVQHHLQQQQPQQYPHLLSVQVQASLAQQRSESRPPSQSYGSKQRPVPVPLSLPPRGPPRNQQSSDFLPTYQMSPTSLSQQSCQLQGPIARSPPTSPLPRLNTGEMHIRPPPSGPSGMRILLGQPGHPLRQPQTAQQAQQASQSSPSISFCHWQPPTSKAGRSNASQLITSSDHISSSKKRKAQGSQQSATHQPPDPNALPYHSPEPDHLSGTRRQADVEATTAIEVDPHPKPGFVQTTHLSSEAILTTSNAGAGLLRGLHPKH